MQFINFAPAQLAAAGKIARERKAWTSAGKTQRDRKSGKHGRRFVHREARGAYTGECQTSGILTPSWPSNAAHGKGNSSKPFKIKPGRLAKRGRSYGSAQGRK